MTRPVRAVAVAVALGGGGCAEPDVLVNPPSMPSELGVGQRRTIELRFTRLDVEGTLKENTLEDLRAMPRRVLEDIWLLDLDITPLTANALAQLRAMDPQELAKQPQAVQNMRALLSLTPDNANLQGTSLEELSHLSSAVGIPTARAFANLLQVGVTEDFVPPDIVAAVIADHVIASHPNAQFRRGPVDAEHPDGMVPVAPNSIPLTLADVVTNFENMAERFGPVGDHPGFVASARGVSVIEDDFMMRSLVNVNALPFKGVDLGHASAASVSNVAAQIDSLHDFSVDDWLTLEGLVETPLVEEFTIRVQENDAFISGGDAREPAGRGNGPVWDSPEWEFEYLVAEMARRTMENISGHCDEYDLATGATALRACVDDDGWVALETFNDIGTPPEPSYLWDIELELGQVRLHDGGLAEGEGDIEFTVHNLEVGVSPEALVEQIRANVQANPEALREFATLLIDNAHGEADFFYYRAEDGRDWLYFVTPDDIPLDDAGNPVRDYDYEHVGFFGNRSLSDDRSSAVRIDGDDTHLKVEIAPGDVLFVADDRGAVFEVTVLDKPSRARIALDLRRVD